MTLGFDMGRPKQPPLTVDRQPPPPDQGAELVAKGRLPGADAITLDGKLAWTWDSVCRVFGADPHELAALLKTQTHERRGRDVGLYEVMR